MNGFARDKFLRLKVSKCEVVEFGRQCVQVGGGVSDVEVEGVVINPRRACAARVTAVVLCVCLSVCLSVCLLPLFR